MENNQAIGHINNSKVQNVNNNIQESCSDNKDNRRNIIPDGDNSIRSMSCRKKVINFVTPIISLCALFFSIIAICNVCPRTDIGFDYMGAIMGILSLLVTALIGWNIYTIIDFKEKDREMKAIKKDAIKEKERLWEELHSCLSTAYYASYVAFDGMKQYPGAITSLVCTVGNLLYDVKSNVAVGNFQRLHILLLKNLEDFQNDTCKFGENNCRILYDTIANIQKHVDWQLIKHDYENVLTIILQLVESERKA